MNNAKVIVGRGILLTVFFCLCLFYSTETLAKAPYCSERCDWDSDCDTSCTNEYGETITCYQWGVCDSSSLTKTSITIDKAYPYAFPDPYGFGLRMEYRITLAKGCEAVSVTTQYSPDGGVTWYTDESSRSPTYNWDNIHGDIECGSARYNLESNHTYTLRAILNYRASGALYHKDSNRMTATVDNYDPPVLYDGVGHIPEEDRVNWQNAGLLPENRSGLLPETPSAADNVFDVTSMPGADLDAQISEAIERARTQWNDYGETSIIYFPPGKHRINSPIELHAGDSNIIFQGAGADGANPTVLECKVGINGTCFYIHGSTGGFSSIRS